MPAIFLVACLVLVHILATAYCPVRAADTSFASVMQVPPAAADTETEQVNRFIANSGSVCTENEREVVFDSFELTAKLLHPLNSGFNQPGDSVTAVVAEPVAEKIRSFLPVGTVLRGDVEDVRANGRFRREGALSVRFYQFDSSIGKVDLHLAPASSDTFVHPVHLPPGRKQIIRGILMRVTSLAVPLAIGSGGVSLAITAGAGAMIGAALADDHKYIHGAIRGAWDGAGLSILDPLLFKGSRVVLPAGTLLSLRLLVPARIPRSATPCPISGSVDGRIFASLPSSRGQPAQPALRAVLSTSARVISQTGGQLQGTEFASSGQDQQAAIGAQDDPLRQEKEFLAQKNLAAALNALDEACTRNGDDPRINLERERLLPLLTGTSPLR